MGKAFVAAAVLAAFLFPLLAVELTRGAAAASHARASADAIAIQSAKFQTLSAQRTVRQVLERTGGGVAEERIAKTAANLVLWQAVAQGEAERQGYSFSAWMGFTTGREREGLAQMMAASGRAQSCNGCFGLGSQGVALPGLAAPAAFLDIGGNGTLVSRNGMARATDGFAARNIAAKGGAGIGCGIARKNIGAVCLVSDDAE